MVYHTEGCFSREFGNPLRACQVSVGDRVKAGVRREPQALYLRPSLARSTWVRATLRIRIASGVTSTHSSSRQNSSDCSSESFRAGMSFSNSSAVEDRTLVI